MIETEQVISIRCPIDEVWHHVRDMVGWSSLIPGLQSCEVIDDDRSRWVLKVGAGGLVRTVKVLVDVAEWAGPGLVRFGYRLEGDPVEGGGTYRARAVTAFETEVTLHIRIVGSGPMAPMWEALGKPLLPQLARAFAGQLKTRIEESARDPLSPDIVADGEGGGFLGWLRALWRRLFGGRLTAN